MTGAVWQTQLLSFACALGFGALGGLAAPLLFRKSGKWERALTDLFAMLIITVFYILAVETANYGKTVPFVSAAFFIGVAASGSSVMLTLKAVRKRRSRRTERKRERHPAL